MITAQQLTPGTVIHHVKSQGQYEVVCQGLIEATCEPAVVYKAVVGGQVWVRPLLEMLDGRFVLAGR